MSSGRGSTAGQQMLLALQWDDEPTLEAFEPGANGLALEALAKLLAGGEGSSVYLWGPAASGKSHLLRAACRAVQRAGNWALYLTPQSPPSHWPALDAFAGTGPAALLAIDDVQACAAWQQDLLFGLFNAARQFGVSFLAAGDAAPAQLELRADVRTRLAWGLALALEPLDDAAKRRVLQSLAARRGFDLRDDLSRYILSHHARDMASLVDLVARLDAYAMQQARATSIPLLKAMLADAGSAPTIKP
ncbi:MAG: DnaA regulatory inactivator Hda [Thiomonas delicata]